MAMNFGLIAAVAGRAVAGGWHEVVVSFERVVNGRCEYRVVAQAAANHIYCGWMYY